jgi:hypothetical protein
MKSNDKLKDIITEENLKIELLGLHNEDDEDEDKKNGL